MCNFVITGELWVAKLSSAILTVSCFAISLLISFVVIIYNFIYRVVDPFGCFSFTLEIYRIATWPPVELVRSFCLFKNVFDRFVALACVLPLPF